jgi:hypothetical protein
MVFTLSIYIKLQQNEEANEALKKIAASGRKILLLPKTNKDIVAEKQKLQTCLTSLKDGLVEC